MYHSDSFNLSNSIEDNCANSTKTKGHYGKFEKSDVSLLETHSCCGFSLHLTWTEVTNLTNLKNKIPEHKNNHWHSEEKKTIFHRKGKGKGICKKRVVFFSFSFIISNLFEKKRKQDIEWLISCNLYIYTPYSYFFISKPFSFNFLSFPLHFLEFLLKRKPKVAPLEAFWGVYHIMRCTMGIFQENTSMVFVGLWIWRESWSLDCSPLCFLRNGMPFLNFFSLHVGFAKSFELFFK